MNQKPMLEPIAAFLGKIAAFHSLPADVLDRLAGCCQVDYRERGSQILTQGETILEHIYIVHQGAVELFYESDQDIDHDILGEGGVYGCLSLLRNKGVSLRSVNALEDTFFYLIPKGDFFDVCAHHEEVRQYFFNNLQTKIYERSLGEFRKKHLKPRQDYDGYIMHMSVGEVIERRVTSCAPGCSLTPTRSYWAR